MSAQPQSDAELVCANCGGFFEQETPTGWCIKCTFLAGYCITCGNINTSPRQYECSKCRDIKWRIKYVDLIEEFQMQGMSMTAAMDQVRINQRCISVAE